MAPPPHEPDAQGDPLADTPIDPRRRRARLWGYFTRYGSWFLGGAVALVVTNALGLAIPAYIGEAVETLRDLSTAGASEEAAVASLTHAGVAIILLALGAGVARVFSRILIFNAGRFIEFDVRNELYAKLAELDQGFYGRVPTGDITSRVTNDVSYVRLLFAITFLHAINTSLALSIALTQLVRIDPMLTLWCLLPYPFLLFGLRSVIRALFEQTKIVQAQMSTLSATVQENLSGMAVVKTFNLQGRESERFGAMSHDYFEKNMKLATIRGGLQSLIVAISGVGTIVVLAVGAREVAQGRMALGDFVAFNSYIVALAFPISALGWVFSVWHRGIAAFDRVLGVLDRAPVVVSPDDPDTLPPRDLDGGCGEVRFEHVSFSYDEETPILTDIDLTIPGGSTVAFVGKTGAGKTTLVKLVSRLYDPTQGRVLIDGVPLTELALRQTRSEIGFVPQDPFLFSMTIGQNVRFGLDALEHDDSVGRAMPTRALVGQGEASVDERVEQALTIAGLSGDLDAFPDGLDTLVGERGITLSGGQKQRLTIARALLTDPRILILDDALSSVDSRTESIILDHLDVIMRGRTSILLTHRYNALARVDRIFVLDEGRVVEEGSHDELLAQGGVYAQMYAQQKLRERLEE
jgi:ATP-binding cassette subfamily B protein